MCSGSRVVRCSRTEEQTDRQTDTTELIFAFYDFATLPKTADRVNRISWEKHVITHGYALYLNLVFNRSTALTTVNRLRRKRDSNNRDSETRHCTYVYTEVTIAVSRKFSETLSQVFVVVLDLVKADTNLLTPSVV